MLLTCWIVCLKTNHAWKNIVEVVAEIGTRKFLKIAVCQERILTEEKREDESWSHYMHMHMNCVSQMKWRFRHQLDLMLTLGSWQVYKMFVYYTGYKTGQMRAEFPHWAFGIIEFDPNEPYRIIMPNTWRFQEHQPWITLRGNGKEGEWHLRKKYKGAKAPGNFHVQVKDWAATLRPGSFMAIAVCGLLDWVCIQKQLTKCVCM